VQRARGAKSSGKVAETKNSGAPAATENAPVKRALRNAEQTRRALICSAQQAFSASGFAGARVDAIALQSGFNKSLIFQYFGDKEGLYRAVLDQLQEEGDQSYQREVRPQEFVEAPLTQAALRTFLERSTRWMFLTWMSTPHNLGLVSWRMAEGMRLFDLSQLELMPGMMTALSVLEEAQRLGLIQPSIDPRLMTLTVMGLPLMYMRSLPPERLSDQAFLSSVCDQVLTLLVEGLFARSISPG
jgi:TetR/AcrR family transcriptional regulator